MNLLSIPYLFFFLCLILVYYLVPNRFQWIILLLGSLCFYVFSGLESSGILLLVAAVSFFGTKILCRIKGDRLRKCFFSAVILFLCILLFVFKISHAYRDSLATIFFGHNPFSVFLPLGLSYFVLEAIGYCTDVYRGTIRRENSFLHYLSFLSFFPKITQGPISRYSQLSRELLSPHKFSYINLAHGAQLALWGLFKKLVVADQVGIIVDAVYSNPTAGSEVAFALVLYSIQLYGDFSGCIDIVRGCAQILGIHLMENFDYPFSATSIKDFWHRWHISLSTWLRDYIYYPLGGNRKGLFRKYLNIGVVFLISGLWHGTTPVFCAWGLLHAFYQIAEDQISRLPFKKTEYWRKYQNTIGFRFLQRLRVFFLISFSWVFFRSDSLHEAVNLLKLLLFKFKFPVFIRNLYVYQPEPEYLFALFLSIILMAFIEYLQTKCHIRETIDKQPLIIRWMIYIGGILLVVLLGNYGPESSGMFLYANY